jgi:hypothetical protein
MIPEYDKCGRCGRRLKNPESRRLGFGAVCYSKVQTRREHIPLFSVEAKDGPDRIMMENDKRKEKVNG